MSPDEYRYRFGPFILQPGDALLLQDDQPLEVQPKVLDLLTHFVRDPGTLHTRRALLEAVWPDVIVSDEALSQVLRKARVALGDDARAPTWIETVHGKGYRFIGDVRRERIPEPAPHLFGRSDELAAVHAALDDGERLVTLHGPGGIGKTALAQAVLDQRDGRYVELAAARDASDVARAVADALQVPVPTGAEGVPARLARALAGDDHHLVVLDNVEQVAGAVGRALETWLAAVPGHAFLTTSRRPLGLAAEHRIGIGPLDEDASVRLVQERLDPRDRTPAAESLHPLVRALDGIPLALELAAPRLRVTDGAELASTLSERPGLLVDRRGEHPPRHRTLGEALEWSWELLEPWGRRALTRLAVFRGAVETSLAVEMIATHAASDAPDPLLILETLREQSWLVGDPGSGLRLLEPVRTWLRARAPEWTAWWPLHRDLVLAASPGWDELPPGPIAGPAVEEIRAVSGELAAILQRTDDPRVRAQAAIRLALLEDARGLAGAALDRLERLDLGGLTDALAARVLLLRSWLVRSKRDTRDALELARRGTTLAERAGYDDLRCHGWLREADCQEILGDPDAARAQARRVLEHPAADGRCVVLAHLRLASCAHHSAVHDPEDDLRDALRIARRLKDGYLERRARNQLAYWLHRRGRLREALRERRLALDAVADVQRSVHRTGLRLNVAHGLRHLGRHQEAREELEDIVPEARRLGNAKLLGYAAQELATVLADLGEVDRSLVLHDEATAAFEGMPHPVAAAGSELVRGITLFGAARARQARRVLRDVLDRGKRLDDPVLQWRAHYLLADVGLAIGDLDATRRHATAGLSLLVPSDGDHQRTTGLALRGAAHALQGDLEAARREFTEAQEALGDYEGDARYRCRLLSLLARDDRAEAAVEGRQLAGQPRIRNTRELAMLADVVLEALEEEPRLRMHRGGAES